MPMECSARRHPRYRVTGYNNLQSIERYESSFRFLFSREKEPAGGTGGAYSNSMSRSSTVSDGLSARLTA